MTRTLPLLLLLGALLAGPAAAQSADTPRPTAPADDGEAVLRARLAAIGVAYPTPAPGPTATAPAEEDGDALIARRLAARGGAPEGPGDNLAAAGEIRVRGLTTTVRVRAAANVGELHTYQGLDVNSTSRVDPTSGWLVFRGGQGLQAFRSGAPLTLGRVRVDKSAGRLVLDSVGVGGAGSFSFGTLNLTNDVLATASSLPITTALQATTGTLAFTGAATQTLTLPTPGLTVPNVYLEKPSGRLRLPQPIVVSGTLRNAGTATLVGDVTLPGTSTLDLDGGVLTLTQDLPVRGVLFANGGTFDPDGHTLSLDPTPDGGSGFTRLAAVGGDGSTLTHPSPFARPYVDGEGWRLIASPFAAQPFSTLTDDFHTQGGPGADAPFGDTNLIAFDPTRPVGQRYVGVTDFTQPFAPGRGYFFYAYATDPGTGTPELPTRWDVTGVEPADTVTVLLSYSATDGEQRFNLLGNPFAAPMDWHDLQGFARFRASYAVWDPAANGGLGNYAFYNAAGVATGRAGRYIPAFQGFWAESTILTPFGVLYDRAWKEPYETTGVVYAGRAEAARLGGGEAPRHLRFRLEGAGLEATEPVALFLPEGARGADPYDATWLRPLSADYAAAAFVQDSTAERLVFEARPLDAVGTTLALDVEATRAGTYTLSWLDFDAAPAWPLVLEDRATGVFTDLRATPSYTFTLAATAPAGAPRALHAPGGSVGRAAPRFVVHLDAVTGGEGSAAPRALTLEAPRPNPARAAFRVRYGLPRPGAARVGLYDVLGREVTVLLDGEQPAGWHEATFDAAGLAAGVYVVRLEADGAVQTTRLTVAR